VCVDTRPFWLGQKVGSNRACSFVQHRFAAQVCSTGLQHKFAAQVCQQVTSLVTWQRCAWQGATTMTAVCIIEDDMSLVVDGHDTQPV